MTEKNGQDEAGQDEAGRGEGEQAPDSRNMALAAVVFVLLLVGLGLMLTHRLRNASDLQDCLMTGRRNCADAGPSVIKR